MPHVGARDRSCQAVIIRVKLDLSVATQWAYVPVTSAALQALRYRVAGTLGLQPS
jgi:hypothetical protein